ncbi:MAG: TolC family protein [Ignavibacteria bacterium]
MRKLFVLVFIFTLSVSYLNAQEVYDLTKSVNTAIQNSTAVSTYQNNITLQKFNVKSSYGDLIPTLNFSGQWSRNNTDSKGGTIYQNGIPIAIPDNNTTADNFSLGLNSSMTLFNGFSNYENIDLQKKSLASLYTDLEKTKYDIIMSVYQRFFDVIKKDKIVETNNNNLLTSIDQLNKIKEYVNVGKKTQSDVYKQDVQVGQNELTVVTSKNDFEKAKVDFLATLNDDVTKSIIMDYSKMALPVTLQELRAVIQKNANFESLVQNALKTRYDYTSAQQSIQINEMKLSIAKKNLYFPSLSAFGNYNWSSNNLNSIDKNKVLSYGLTLSYPILQGFKTDLNRQVAEVNIKQKQEDIAKLEKLIRSDLKKSIYDLESSYKQIEILDRNIISAEQDKLLSEENFRIGYGTLLDVQVATTNLNNLYINRINALYNFVLSQKQIEYLSGQLKY